MSVPVLATFESAAVAEYVSPFSELVWIVCPVHGWPFEAANILEAISHVKNCALASRNGS